ncbi:MAG: CoA-transferase subunit beta [Dehalococcoidia bacterium]|nr:CoA-transferase subunit beta [Dehalococcoidia bacterium]
MSEQEYTLAELMCVAAARAFPVSGVVMAGMGLPMLTATFAKLLQPPGIVICTEVGAFDWRPPPDVSRAPVGIHDINLNDGSAMVSDMVDALGTLLMGGNVDLGVLSAAQVDRFGNLNTLVLGDYRHPERRLGGTGGNTEIACLAKRVLTIMPQERRRFVERVDFNTSPGYIDGPGARLRAGLPPQGPNAVVSTFGVFGFDTGDGGDGSCEMVLEAVFPGMDPDIVRLETGWPLRVADGVAEIEPPTAEEIALLRRLDPHHFYLTPGRY